ncbi:MULTISPECIES: hypothetical protein [Paenibacillus]|uniref:Non-ribosomal peptide synthetase module n=3 Tax=Paenibacillus TaxID=44249 RepID=A0AAJ2JTR1_9BACL|nr:MULTISPECIES: hypothetical protein [Paenibacillus]EPY10223.1 hypothetical protein PAAL66ix_23795 [Paenibacillus alvei A6-6i-x]MCM3289402.1 hypothetical protein [Paenibacillus sp. MER 180]MCY9531030.1 hypothetical protein [Paenibacillus alvei]MDT8976908.1 hypothetical protein [Paenibacillus sp. chi10]OBY81248.1 hypothetical protein BBG47_01540 [Paenibacillus sp. KS1]
MNRSDEVEYCNLELRFDRRQIQNLIRDLIQEGYSLYWSENESLFIVSIRTGRKLVKLRFQRMEQRYKIVGDYTIRDEKLADFMEKLIGDSRGHAVVKRFKDRQIFIENILFGERIRLVEVIGPKQRVLYQKRPIVTTEEMMQAFLSNRAEQRMRVLRLEMDYVLAELFEAMNEQKIAVIERCKEKLNELRSEMIQLEW